jgi:dipeptidyl aminopeptidase/acylaminoacyl peptidase
MPTRRPLAIVLAVTVAAPAVAVPAPAPPEGPAASGGDTAPGPDAPPAATTEEGLRKLRSAQEDLDHRLDELAKAIDDVRWAQLLGDVAWVEKWRIAGPPPARPKDPDTPGARNPVKFYTYTFVPKARAAGEKLPVILMPHGGVHADLATMFSAHVVRELVDQGYVVVAPDYRGSTGYGKKFYELVDYGGREVDDAHAAKEWALENLEGVDPTRVGLVGWSHGGLIVLLEAFARPKEYRCVFAGVPVSDLVARMGYSDEEYRGLFSAPYHLGKTVREDIEEYKRRSPVWNVGKLEIPLLVHGNTNDEDVNYLEVEHLLQALQAAGKKFEYRVFDAAPGGHHMDRLDTRLARDARRDVYRFLARHLKPPRPPR